MATTPEARQALIDNTPPKCPYFTLPDVRHFLKATRASKAREKTGYVSIVALWGASKKMTEHTTTDFLLQLLKHSDWQPDFEAVALEWQLSGTSHMYGEPKICAPSTNVHVASPDSEQSSKAKATSLLASAKSSMAMVSRKVLLVSPRRQPKQEK